MLAALMVTTTADSGTGSLRQAIHDANANSGSDTIAFNIPTSDPGFVDVDSALPGGDATPDAFVIKLLSTLPAIDDATGGTTIDGRTQTSFSGDTNPFGPEIVLDGGSSNRNGLFISSDNNAVYGLNVRAFSGAGVFIAGSDNNTVAGNYIGTDATGTRDAGNHEGVKVNTGGKNNVVGTNGDGITDDAEWNLISGNSASGVVLLGAGTSGNVIAGNDIGTDASGATALGNGGFGVFVLGGAQHNLIGTDGDGVADAAERNTISGNINRGIWMSGIGTDHNVIAGNYIGVDKTGSTDLGNGSQGYHSGITIANGSKFNLVGTDGDGTADDVERNVISGNTGYGVLLSALGTDANVVAGNYIGTNAAGTAAIPNDRDGVAVVSGAQLNLIGTNGDGIADNAERNVIGGNNWNGVYLAGGDTRDNVVAGNYIGTDALGRTGIGNGDFGVRVQSGATDNIIGTNGDGTADAAEQNVISGNIADGVVIAGSGTDRNVVAGNFLGTDATGQLPIGNKRYGVQVAEGARFNRIGTDGNGIADAMEGNLVSGNLDSGVAIMFATTANNIVAGNLIGTDSTGNLPLSNQNFGILIGGGGVTHNLIGTDGDGAADELERNIISGNGGVGVFFAREADSNVLAGNFIGTNATGEVAIGNGLNGGWALHGVFLTAGASENIIGTDGDGVADASERNIISGNKGHGIVIGGMGADHNTIAGNYIGVDKTGSVNLGNGTLGSYSGIRLAGSARFNRVGTNADGLSDSDEANLIAFNTSAGVTVAGSETVGNSIRGNSIYSNGSLGIDLSGGAEDAFGVTANDPGDLDVGPNNLQNAPGITAAKVAYDVVIEGQLNSSPNTTFEIDLYANDSGTAAGSEEGERFLTSLSVVTDATGDAVFSVTLPQSSVSAGELITATATDGSANTSEFSSGLTAEKLTTVEIDTLGDLVIYDGSLVGSEINNNLQLELVNTTSGTNVRVSDLDNELAAGYGTTLIDAHTVEVPLASITGFQGIVIDTSHGDDSLTIVYDPAMAYPRIDFTAGDQSATGPGDSLTFAGTAIYSRFIMDGDSGRGLVDNQGFDYQGVDLVTSRLTVSEMSTTIRPRVEEKGSVASVTLQDGGLGRTIMTSSGGHSFGFISARELLEISAGGILRQARIDLQGLGSGFDADVQLSASDIDITGPVDLGTGSLILNAMPSSRLGMRTIVLGMGIEQEFDLSDAEIDQVTASSIQIGRSIRGGTVTVAEPISPANVDTLHLVSGAISQTTGSLQVANLSLFSFGDVKFPSANNDITNLAISVKGDAIFTDANTLNVADVETPFGTVSGVNVGGSLELNALQGPLIIQETSALTDVSGNSIRFHVSGNDQALRVESGAHVESATLFEVNSDEVDLQGTMTAGENRVAFETQDSVNLGSTGDSVAETLELSDAELNRITAPIIQIGGYSADGSFSGGPIEVTQLIKPASFNTLSLITGATIDDGTTGALNVPNLAIRSVGSATLDNWELGNSVDDLAAEISGKGGKLRFENDGALNIATVIDGLEGVTTQGGGSYTRTHSPLIINAPVTDLGGGDITLIAGESGSEDDDLIIAAPVRTSGGDGSISLSAGDDVQIVDMTGDEVSVTGSGSITISAEDEVDLAPGVTLETEQGMPEIFGGSVGISGTELDDQIEVIPTADGLQLEVFLDGILIATASSEGRVKIHGLAGNDTIEADGSIAADLWFDGGAGNDRLKGAHGNDVLLGGDGDDLLVGKGGRDLLVGGMGADRIIGNADDDILISGYLDFGATPIDTAVSYVMLEWTSSRTYEQRMNNSTNGSGATERENDNYFLQWLNTVHDDQDKDILTGSSGSDWFFANLDNDRITDLKDEAFADEWNFIMG